MELIKNFIRPSLEIAKFSKFNFAVGDTESFSTVLEISRYNNFTLLLKSKNSNAIVYRLEGCNINEETKEESNWVVITNDLTLNGNSSVIIDEKCVTDKIRLVVRNQTTGQNGLLDIFVRLNPYAIIY